MYIANCGAIGCTSTKLDGCRFYNYSLQLLTFSLVLRLGKEREILCLMMWAVTALRQDWKTAPRHKCLLSVPTPKMLESLVNVSG